MGEEIYQAGVAYKTYKQAAPFTELPVHKLFERNFRRMREQFGSVKSFAQIGLQALA